LRPEFLFTEPLSFPKLLARAIQDGAEVRGVRHQEALDLVFVLDADDDRDWATVARDNDRSAFTGIQKSAELMRLHLSDRSNLHRASSPVLEAMALCANGLLLAGRVCDPKSNESRGFLWIVSLEDGSKRAEYALNAPPAQDGLAVADQRVFLALEDGNLVCFGQ
jgi:hypothetical protein